MQYPDRQRKWKPGQFYGILFRRQDRTTRKGEFLATEITVIGERVLNEVHSKGAQVIAGGKGASVVMPATVVDGVTAEMNLYRDESFGPVVAMIRARDADHAVELANDTQYGLSAAVFTRDIAKGLTIARRIQHMTRARSALDGDPRYVVEIDAPSNRVVIGTADLLGVDLIVGDHVRWCGPAPGERVALGAQVRAHGEEVPATAEVQAGPSPTVRVGLERRVRGVAPGQSVVLYEGTRVVGSATISETGRA